MIVSAEYFMSVCPVLLECYDSVPRAAGVMCGVIPDSVPIELIESGRIAVFIVMMRECSGYQIGSCRFVSFRRAETDPVKM